MTVRELAEKLAVLVETGYATNQVMFVNYESYLESIVGVEVDQESQEVRLV